MKRYGFFNTFISVCSGTSIFPEIVKFPFRRMVWHLFILAVLGGAVNVAFRYHPFNVLYEESCLKLQKEFGDLVYSEKGILPTENPDKQGTVYLEDFRVDYFPKIEELKDFKPEDDASFGIAWSPNSISAWILSDGKPAPFMPLLMPVAQESEEFRKSISHMWEKIKGDTDGSLSLFDMAEIYKIPSSQLKAGKRKFRKFETNMLGIPYKITTVFIFYLISQIFINCLFFSPMYILIFSLFSYFLGKSNMLSVTFKELFIVGIYTGFPGLVIATLYTALNLPVLDFQSVFLISYLFYSFPVFSRLQFAQMQKENPSGSERKE